MSSVSSMELEGISNACSTNVMMKRPVTSTPPREARNSTVVSRGCSSTMTSSCFGTFGIRFRKFYSAHRFESSRPARFTKEVDDDVLHVLHPVPEVALLVLVLGGNK